VDGPTANGIAVSDGGENACEILLERERMGMKRLLRFGDVILFYRPWLTEVTAGVLSIVYGPNTVMFRVPVNLRPADLMSQVSQHNTVLAQDGLFFRNRAACRAIHGTIAKIEHFTTVGEWTSSTIYLNNPAAKISVGISDCAFETTRSIAGLRASHYVWFFGLIEREVSNMYFTAETSVYNTVMLHAIVASDIVRPALLDGCGAFTTFIARAVIVAVECSPLEVHSLCRAAVPRSGACSLCRAGVGRDAVQDAVVRMEIDDGSCDPVPVVALASVLAFWTAAPDKWGAYTEARQRGLLRELVGRELVFVLSRGCEEEFGEYSSAECWRVDRCGNTAGDVEREVEWLRRWHRDLDTGAP